MIAFALLLLAILVEANSVKTEQEGPIGQAFDIHHTDLLSKALPTEGIKIVKNFAKKCIIKTPKNTDNHDDAYLPTTKSIYSDLASNSKLEPELRKDYTLKTSLDALTNSISVGDKGGSVAGYALRYFYYRFQKSISQKCLNDIEFTDDFMKSFQELPVKIERPRYKTSWYKYKRFIEKYGTHMIKSVTYGSSISQFSFALGSKKYTEKDLRARACGKFIGSEGNVSAPVCKGFTEEDRKKAYQLDISTRMVIRGGSQDTRAKLLFKRTKELIEKFQSESETSAAPVKYSFVPIWEILKVKFYGTPDYARANNLEEYFKGLLNFGCGYLEIDGKEMQVFEKTPQSPVDSPTYQCKLRDQGCLTDKDCHYLPLLCSCNGPSCIEHREEKRGDGSIRKVPYAWHDKRRVERGCAFNYSIPPKCICETKAGFLVTWYNGSQRS